MSNMRPVMFAPGSRGYVDAIERIGTEPPVVCCYCGRAEFAWQPTVTIRGESGKDAMTQGAWHCLACPWWQPVSMVADDSPITEQM